MEEAIDPVTGEINWNCPCMGNNTQGPCGELFKNAFKCFISNRDNLEICTDKFTKMNKCQAKYPLIYNDEKEENN